MMAGSLWVRQFRIVILGAANAEGIMQGDFLHNLPANPYDQPWKKGGVHQGFVICHCTLL
jgi:hypothetical protein